MKKIFRMQLLQDFEYLTSNVIHCITGWTTNIIAYNYNECSYCCINVVVKLIYMPNMIHRI